MGMLQLAGAVSGFGKGLQQGLQQTQQYMSQSLLLEERDKMEQRRMDITYGRELGMLKMKHGWDTEAADLAHSRVLDKEDQRQDFEAGENRKTRAAQRENAELQAQRELEREDKRQQNTVTNKVLDASYEQQKEATKSKQDLAKEARDRADRRAERKENIGKDIVIETLRNQRPHGGSASTNPELNNQFKVLTDEIKGLEHMIANEFNEGKKKKLQDELERKIAERRTLANLPSTQKERKPIIFPE